MTRELKQKLVMLQVTMKQMLKELEEARETLAPDQEVDLFRHCSVSDLTYYLNQMKEHGVKINDRIERGIRESIRQESETQA